jgi:predicted metal-binding protein
MKKDLSSLLADLSAIHRDFKLIHAREIEVAEWVRWKCRYGCKAYGKHLGCPPYTPAVEETRKLVQCYERAIVVRVEACPDPSVPPSSIHHHLWNSIKQLHDTIFALERQAFLAGYYKAIALGGLPCSYCDDCLPERPDVRLDHAAKRFCLHQDRMRPSMEACGIDAFATVRRAGYEVEVLTSPEQPITLFGLILLE